MKPMWEEIEAQFPELESEFYDADENPEKLEEWEVNNIPTFIYLDKNGEEFSRMTGAQNKEELSKFVEDNLTK